MNEGDARITLLKKFRRKGFPKDTTREVIKLIVEDSAQYNGWNRSELTLTLEDWYTCIEQVYTKKGK